MTPDVTYRPMPMPGGAFAVSRRARAWRAAPVEVARELSRVIAWEAEGGLLAKEPAARCPKHKRKGAATMGMNDEYVSRMETQLKRWDADVDALAAEGEKVSAETRAVYHEQITNLRARRDETQRTFQEYRFAGESAGAQLHAGMEGAWDAMQKALEKVSSDLRK